MLPFWLLLATYTYPLELGIVIDADEGKEIVQPQSPVWGASRKKVEEIDEVFTPVNEEERNIVLDINDPEVQKVIHSVVSASIKEAFKNKQLEEELRRKKACCNSSTKLKIALLTALSSTATAVVTIILNNQ
jgi:rRNA processing protein Gar1